MFDYAQLRDGLFGILAQLEGTVRDVTSKSLGETRIKLEEEAFNLVVLGQFKRGKSTFINALLGESILPTAIIPLTSVVTILRYGPKLKVEVEYLNGRLEGIDLASLPAFITERENPQNKKAVKEVTVFYPSQYLKGGVRIIDTPGTGSVYSHNTEAAYAYLPYVDAGIFVVSVDPPLSKSEHQFLKDVREFVDKVFFVLNKVDQVSDSDQKESLEFTVRVIEEEVGQGKVRIYPLSARWAIEGKKAGDALLLERSLLPEFERQLLDFLAREKGRVFLQSVVNNLLKLISDETISFQLEQEAIKLPLQELKTKIERFEQEMKEIAKDRENTQFLLKGHLGKIISGLDEEIFGFKREKSPALQRELEEEYLRLVNRGGGGLREKLEQFVFDRIRATFNPWRQQLAEKISARLEEAHGEFARKINEIVERILILTSDIFELKLKPFTSVEGLSKKSYFYFMLKDDPVGLELIQLAATSTLPSFIARKMILKSTKEAVAELLDRHCGRVRYDLVNRITKTMKDFQNSLYEKIDLTLAGIRISFQKALALHQTGQNNLEKSLGELSEKLGSIAAIHSGLLGYAALLDHDSTKEERGQALPPGRTP
ncbi:MAG: dynamin family protein [Syntrophobacteraceae bacterium]|jgi:GTP-binding protein EngB required for normal cell division